MILQIFIIFIIFISVLFFCLSNYFSLEYWSYFSLTLKKKKKTESTSGSTTKNVQHNIYSLDYSSGYT